MPMAFTFWSQGRENESEGVRHEGMDGACAKVAGVGYSQTSQLSREGGQNEVGSYVEQPHRRCGHSTDGVSVDLGWGREGAR